MSVIASTGKERNWTAALRRVMDSAWFGTTNNAEQVPLMLAGEFATGVNTAGTGTNQILGMTKAYTIVDGSATSLFTVACAALGMSGGLLFYHVQSSDGTDMQSMAGMVSYAVVNKAGTLTLVITNAAANDAKAVSAGTLTLSWTFVTGTNLGTVKLTPTGSLTETTYTVTMTVFPITGAVTLL